MTENIYFISLGGLIKTDLSKSVSAFGGILAKESSFPYFTEARIYIFLFMDQVYYKTIDSYKLGEINTSEFRIRIADQLGIKNSPEIETAWNAMCELTAETKERIVSLLQHQQAEQFKLCIVSGTNPLQYNYVIKQIKEGMIGSNSNIVIKTSFEEHSLELSELAKIAIVESNWDLEGNNIISYDSRLTEENLMLKNAAFIYDDNQSWLSFFGEHTQDL